MEKFKKNYHKFVGLIFMVIFIFLANLDYSYARRIRNGSISWDEFMDIQIQSLSQTYTGNRQDFKKAIRDAKKYLPQVINWVKHIFDNYEKKYGGGKLVFIGGAAKKAYQVAKILSIKYENIDSSDVIYLYMPRDIIGSSSHDELDRFMEQKGVYQGKKPVTLVDVCIDWSKRDDPIINLAKILNKKRSELKLYYATIYNRGGGYSVFDEGIEKKLFQDYQEYGHYESLFKFLEDSSRARFAENLVNVEGNLVPDYKLTQDSLQIRYRAQTQIIYSYLAKEFNLSWPAFLNNNFSKTLKAWKDFTLRFLSNINKPVTFKELKQSLGIIAPEDENWFIDAVETSLKGLVEEGKVIKEKGKYRIKK